MRKIKFRGFTVNEEKFNNGKDGWIYGNLSVLDDGTVDIQDINDNNWFKAVNPESVGQYTGLKDKKGKEIYEGDILTIPEWLINDNQKVCICIYDQENTVSDIIGFGLYTQDGYSGKFKILVNSDEWDEFEVIGNIYDNLKLLGGNNGD